MKVLVTGGMGFIGSHFVNLLAKKEPTSEIIVLDKITYAANPNNLNVQVKFIKEDICDVQSLPNVDYIVHFAAESHVDNSIKNGRPFIRSNVEGTFNLIELARKMPTLRKFIHISTDEVYGDMEPNQSAAETDNLNPSSYYSSTKTASDLLVTSAGRTYGLPYIITRTCNNFGENQHKEKMIPKIFKCISENTPVPVYGDGEQVREWIHADDNAEAIYNIMVSDLVNEIFNIGSGFTITNNKLIKIISQALGKPVNFNYVSDRLGHDRRYSLDSTKYKNIFGSPTNIDLTDWLYNKIK